MFRAAVAYVVIALAALGFTKGWAWNDTSKAAGFAAEDGKIPTSTAESLPTTIDSDFEMNVPTFIRVAAGSKAFLSCKPRSLRNKTVSWVRHRDVHILTVGRYTYTTDARFTAHHQRHTGEWTLEIRSVQLKDQGLYECQIGTQPTRSFFVNLHVVEPSSIIPGGPDLHIQEGSAVNITCIVQNSVEPPEFFFWYHNGQVVDFGRERYEKRAHFADSDLSVSSLLINQAQVTDSGNYSCQPAHSPSSSVRVHVLKGEQPAAMQRSGTIGTTLLSRILVTISAIICFVYFRVFM